MTEALTYQGHCHCGAVRFSFRSEEIRRGCRCNCSICVRKGTIMSTRYYPPADFEWLAGAEAVSVHRFGDRLVNHYFCRTCGIHPFHDASTNPGHFRVNLGCVEGLDCLALPIDLLDGKSF